MDTTTAPPGWYADPAGAPTLRYWDGASWTQHLAPPALPVAPAAKADDGPSTAQHWLMPVGRSWQSIVAGYLGFLCLALAAAGPIGVVVGGVTVGLGVWALRLAPHGGHGRGRAIFGLACGGLAVVIGLATSYFWVTGF